MVLLRAYANLYYLFKDLFGLEIELLKLVQSFGFFVAMAFLGGAWVLSRELKRKEKQGLIQAHTKTVTVGEAPQPAELIINFLLGFIIGFKVLGIILNTEVALANPQAYILSGQGSWLGGLALGAFFTFLKYREKKKKQLDKPKKEQVVVHPYQLVGDITVVAAVSGILGAKLFYLFESPGNLSNFLQDPMGSFFGGLTIYGGLIMGAIVVSWYVWKRGIHPIHVADATAPGLFLAYGIGRIGCQVSGDGDWGVKNTLDKPDWIPQWLWSQKYAHGVGVEKNPDLPTEPAGKVIDGCTEEYCLQLAEGVWPTPIYETMMALALFGLLMALRNKIKVPGVMFALYFALNGVERFFIEKIRVNTKLELLGIQVTQAEIIAVVFILIGIIGIFLSRKYLRKLNPNLQQRS